MLTEHEARELYAELLGKLDELGASALARDIEISVLRGAPRKESGPRAQELVYQAALSAREALAVALRMLLAALEPVLQVASVREVLQNITAPDSDALEVRWAFDRIGPVEGYDADVTLSLQVDVLGEIEELPRFSQENVQRLRELAKNVELLVGELNFKEE